MRPTPIPETEVWEGAERRVLAPPDGDLTNPDIAPLEVVVDRSFDGAPRYCARMQLEDGDLAKLTAGGHVWIAFYSCVIPFAVDVKGPGIVGLVLRTAGVL